MVSPAARFSPGPEHREIVFLTGSGISARTGLGTFRGPEGLWALEPETEQAMHAELLPESLPQLWNVLRGDMSLVGPRPALPQEVAGYDGDAHRRLAVRPGITGLWQVSGRSDLSWEDTVRLDLFYVDNWSFAQDLLILARTARAVLASRGAY